VNTPPNCERCGAPAYNVTGRGEHTGRHTDVDECLRELNARIASLEKGFDRAEKAAIRRARHDSLDQALNSGDGSYKP